MGCIASVNAFFRAANWQNSFTHSLLAVEFLRPLLIHTGDSGVQALQQEREELARLREDREREERMLFRDESLRRERERAARCVLAVTPLFLPSCASSLLSASPLPIVSASWTC